MACYVQGFGEGESYYKKSHEDYYSTKNYEDSGEPCAGSGCRICEELNAAADDESDSEERNSCEEYDECVCGDCMDDEIVILQDENDRLMLLLEECYSELRGQRKGAKKLMRKVRAELGV